MQKLIINFTTSCWIPSCKALITFMKTLDKKIPNFQLYFNAKKYNSTNKVNITDKERYDALIGEIVTLVRAEESLKVYLNFHTRVELVDIKLLLHNIICIQQCISMHNIMRTHQ